MMSRKIGKVYTKFVLSYILVFISIVVIMSRYVSYGLMTKYEEVKLEQAYFVEQNTTEKLQKAFRQIQETLNQVLSDHTITKIKYNNAYTNQQLMEAIKQIKSYCLTNPYIDEIVFYYKDLDLFISSNTPFNSKDNYIIKKLRINDTENFMEFLEGVKGTALYEGEYVELLNKRFYTVASAYPNTQSNVNSIVIAFLDTSKVVDSVKESFLGQAVSFKIKDTNTGEQILYNELNISQEPFEQNKVYEIGEIIEQEEREYFKSTFELGINDLQLDLVLSMEDIFSDIKQMEDMIWGISIIAVMIGLILSFMLAEYNYRPIRWLQNYLLEECGVDSKQFNKDEYANIRRGIGDLYSKTRDLEEKKYKYDEIIEILHEQEKIEENKVQYAKGEEDIEESLRYIENNYMDMNFSVGKVCELFNYAPNTYTQKFKKVFNKTPIQYVTELRMDRLKELLITTDLPIKILVEQVGYRDNSTCSKKFTKIVGMSPSQYREQFSILKESCKGG